MSTINELLNQQKQIQAQIDAVDPDAIKKAQREKDRTNMQADIDVSNAGYDSQIGNTKANYGKQIDDTKIAYEDAYQKNAVQKLINEKQIAERNANLGLTDSGLNRTQQTAAQLSYANQKGKIDLSLQSALDELNLKLTDAITALENDKATAVRNITNNWNAYSDEQAQNTYNTKITGLVNQYNSLGEQITDMYKADADAAADVQKAAISASASGSNSGSGSDTLLWYFTGTYDDDKNPIFRNSDGKTQAFGKGVNPYTGTKHKDAKYGTFSNGYQPNNVGTYKDKNGNTVVNKLSKTGIKDYVNGVEQNVWQTDDGTMYIWDGTKNRYLKYEE